MRKDYCRINTVGTTELSVVRLHPRGSGDPGHFLHFPTNFKITL